MHKLENKTSEKARMARPTVQDVGRNKTARRQQGWAFPAIRAGNASPALNARTGFALVPTGSVGMQCKARCAANHDQRLAYTGRSASCTAFPRGAWE